MAGSWQPPRPWQSTTGHGSHHNPTVAMTGSAGLLVSLVASSWIFMARNACFGTSVLGRFGPLLAFFFDLQDLKNNVLLL